MCIKIFSILTNGPNECLSNKCNKLQYSLWNANLEEGPPPLSWRAAPWRRPCRPDPCPSSGQMGTQASLSYACPPSGPIGKHLWKRHIGISIMGWRKYTSQELLFIRIIEYGTPSPSTPPPPPPKKKKKKNCSQIYASVINAQCLCWHRCVTPAIE